MPPEASQHHRIVSRTTLIVLFGTLVWAGGTTAGSAQDLPRENTVETARTLGMGTGGRASVLGTAALAQNPANLGLAELYHLEAVSGFVPGGGWWIGGNVVDSVSSRLAAGLSVRGVFDQDVDDYSGIDARLALGLPVSKKFGIGISGRYLRLRPDQDPTGPDGGTKGFTMDAAMRVSPIEGLHISALGYNLIDRGTALVPRLVGGGASYAIMNMLTVGADVLVDITTFDSAAVVAGGGLELLVVGKVPLRLGYRFAGGHQIHSVTGSVGYVSRQFGADVALRQDVAGAKDTQLLVNVRYHVQ